jgi:hypothetical protein
MKMTYEFCVEPTKITSLKFKTKIPETLKKWLKIYGYKNLCISLSFDLMYKFKYSGETLCYYIFVSDKPDFNFTKSKTIYIPPVESQDKFMEIFFKKYGGKYILACRNINIGDFLYVKIPKDELELEMEVAIHDNK